MSMDEGGETATGNDVAGSVRDYYGEVLQSSADLKTSACCPTGSMPAYLREIVKQIHPEVQDRFYGCGAPLPPALEGATVLDLGSGSGRDCYVLSKLVRTKGKVIGVDMTLQQIEVAERHKEFHAQAFGYKKSNVEFRQGDIGNLRAAGVADNSVDLIVSNCVLNLTANKQAVFSEAWRVLKPGGELYFADVFADRRIPAELLNDPVLVGECLAGALYVEDFRRIMAGLGCLDARQCASSVITLQDDAIKEKIGMVNFRSITWRAFKLPLEDRCEDFGQVATYQGGIAECPHVFTLDDHHHFIKGKPLLVCGNTADMLSGSRYGKFFQIQGDKSTHYGLFDCTPVAASASGNGCC
jgi:SAM-dependent methyltransferase